MPESVEARAERQRLQLLEMRASVESLKKQLEDSKASHVNAHNTVSELELKYSKLENRVASLKAERRKLKDALLDEPPHSRKRQRCGGEVEHHLFRLARNDCVFRRLAAACHPDRLGGSDAKSGAFVMKLLTSAR